jgi:hypothetical protein
VSRETTAGMVNGKHMKTLSGLILVLAMSTMAMAAPSPNAEAEIAGLMDALAKSGCQFQRNGDWHDAKQARAHLQRKYDYLLKKNMVDTSEQFIQRAASQSSVSGRAYRVRCAGKEQDAATWFGGQLRRLRHAGTTAL